LAAFWLGIYDGFMQISPQGLELIRRWEGLRLRAYLDASGIVSIGYGNTLRSDGSPVQLGDSITAAEAEQLLTDHINNLSEQLNGLLKVTVQQPQFDALVSLAYNIGIGALQRSTLLAKLNSGDITAAADQFRRWTKASDGKGGLLELPGLVRRRQEERELFLSATNTASPQSYLRLIRTNQRSSAGLNLLELSYHQQVSNVGAIKVVSGAPGHQFFRTGAASKAGSLEPLPEGQWYVHDIIWSNGKDNYSAEPFGPGLGPVSTPLSYEGPGETERGDIEIHIDANRELSPGTAGCIGVLNVDDYRTLVSWLRRSDPRQLYVDWGLGSCPKP
jgi:GH24 family phage-related lysozyme (muramidase)